MCVYMISVVATCLSCPQYAQRYSLAHTLRSLKDKSAYWRRQLSDNSLALFPDFQQRLMLLNQLGYLESDGSSDGFVVTLKGRVACEMSTCDELVATEMIFDNVSLSYM